MQSRGDVSPELIPQLRSFQGHIQRDGIKRVSKAGVLRHDCPPAPAVGAGKDCFVYVISGSQVVPIGGVQKLNARLRLWVEPSDGTLASHQLRLRSVEPLGGRPRNWMAPSRFPDVLLSACMRAGQC